MTEIDYTEK